MDLVDSQQARRILDRLVGYNISPILWKKVKKGFRQDVFNRLRCDLIIDRENEINALIRKNIGALMAQFEKGKTEFDAALLRRRQRKK